MTLSLGLAEPVPVLEYYFDPEKSIWLHAQPAVEVIDALALRILGNVGRRFATDAYEASQQPN